MFRPPIDAVGALHNSSSTQRFRVPMCQSIPTSDASECTSECITYTAILILSPEETRCDTPKKRCPISRLFAMPPVLRASLFIWQQKHDVVTYDTRTTSHLAPSLNVIYTVSRKQPGECFCSFKNLSLLILSRNSLSKD